MAAYLRQHGIDAARIVQEKRSTTTAENLTFSAKLMDVSSARVGVVTNNFHVYRALGIARACGYQQVFGISSPTELLYIPQATLRECFAIAKDKLVGNI